VEPYVDLPAEWLAIRDRWTRLVGTSFPCRELLSVAVVAGRATRFAARASAGESDERRD
jgi:hypothetical protein